VDARAAWALAATAALLSGAAGAQTAVGPAGGVPAADAGAIALQHVRARSASLGLAPDDLAEAAVRDLTPTRRTGITHVYLRQRLDGIDVVGATLNVAVDRSGRVVALTGGFVPDLRRSAGPKRPRIEPRDAVERAAAALDLAVEPPLRVLEPPSGPTRRSLLSRGGISRDPIPVHLVWLPGPGRSLRLAWNAVVRPEDGLHWWSLYVDAVTGTLLATHDWVADAGYRAFPLPLVSPDEGSAVVVPDPADAVASPFGWHDTDGVPGAEFTDTRGNNVLAQEDADADDSGGFRPEGGPALVFNFPLDLLDEPAQYASAAIVNLFFQANRAHDLFHRYGFDEASGNFQTDNYGRGGLGGDALRADAQDGARLDNANFATPPEGTPPRMQLFLWSADSGPALDVDVPPALAGRYAAGQALFGPALDGHGLAGEVVAALDPADAAGPTPTDACSPLSNANEVAGRIALVDRGTCLFVEKVANAQGAGASGVIVANNAGDAVLDMAGTDPTIAIPSLFVGQGDGTAIRAALPGRVDATLRSLPLRDGDLDAGVVHHEYAHGVTNRLTGGPSDVGCLQASQSRSMGEGWSDFFAIAFTAKAGDAPETPRAIATYLEADPPSGPGIRTAPYSTDPAVNPLVLSDAIGASVPHGAGEVWALALWQVYWKLVSAYGFDADLATGSGGNNRAIGLVVDALKLQACQPTFLAARDAILLADQLATGGADACPIWHGFAERGMGLDASDGGNPETLALVDGFSVPPACASYCGDGAAAAGEECDDGNRLPGDGCAATCENEAFLRLFGVAQGGSISIAVEGVVVSVPTTAGETADEVAAALAAAILADPLLQAAGVGAHATGPLLVTTGSLDAVAIDDPGLSDEPTALPALGWRGLLALAAGFGATPWLVGPGRAQPRAPRSRRRAMRSAS
jgi:cysteine-rich repeat protein